MSAAARAAGGRSPLLAALACAAPAARRAAPPGRDPCPRTRALRPGPTAGAYFATVAPFEHAGSDRTQVFPRSCTLEELTGERRPAIALRSSPQDVATPYNAVTRRRDQLYLYGYGADAATEGGYVASFDPARCASAGGPGSPTAAARAVELPRRRARPRQRLRLRGLRQRARQARPAHGPTLARRRAPGGPGPDRRRLQRHGRPARRPDRRRRSSSAGPARATDPVVRADAGAITGLACAAANGLPTRLVVVEPRRLRVSTCARRPSRSPAASPPAAPAGATSCTWPGTTTSSATPTATAACGSTAAGARSPTARAASSRGPGPGLLGRFVVVQTNFLPSDEPLTVTAVTAATAAGCSGSGPSPAWRGRSWIVSKAALDAATRTVVTHDTAAGRMAALRLDPRRGSASAGAARCARSPSPRSWAPPRTARS